MTNDDPSWPARQDGSPPPGVAPAYPQAQGWGPPPPSSTEKNGLGTWSLVLGILSIVLFGLLAGIPAIVLGVKSRRAAQQGQANNGGLGTAGVVTGIIGTVFSTIFFAFLFAGVLVAGSAIQQASDASKSLAGPTQDVAPSDTSSDTSSSSDDSFTPSPSDFTLTPVIKSKDCFGSAGCNITYRIKVAYNGTTPLPSDVTYEVTYDVTGDTSGTQTNTFTLSGTSAQVQEEFATTASSRVVLKAKATDVNRM